MGAGVNSMLLVNVLSGTEYSVKVIASYSSGPSEPLSGRAKTRESETRLFLPSTLRPPSQTRSPSSGLCSVPGGEQPDAVPGEDQQPVRPVAASAPRQHLPAAGGVPAE